MFRATTCIVLAYSSGRRARRSMTNVIFFHGFTDRARDYTSLTGELAKRWNVIAEDAPGHSEALGRPFQVSEWLASASAQVMDTERCVLIGHSAGGQVAMVLAALHPGRVAGVVALDSPMTFSRELMLSDPIQTHLATMADDPVLGDVVHHLVHRDIDSFLNGFPEDMVDDRVSCAVLLVGADCDLGGLLSDEDVARAELDMRDVRSVRLTGKDHSLGVFSGETDELLEVLLPFLEQVVD